MNRFIKYLKAEIDVEILACTHIATTIIMYGLILWFCGIREIPFAILFEIMWIGYAIAWIQKLLFIKEKAYDRLEYCIRKFLWCAIPTALLFFSGKLFGWFRQVSALGEFIFFAWVVLYLVLWLLALKYLYEEDTKEMNELLRQRKREADDR